MNWHYHVYVIYCQLLVIEMAILPVDTYELTMCDILSVGNYELTMWYIAKW